jgi:hypothetical protein
MVERQDHIDQAQLVTIEEVNRVLEVGRLLLSVLTPEELEELYLAIKSNDGQLKIVMCEKGNTHGP